MVKWHWRTGWTWTIVAVWTFRSSSGARWHTDPNHFAFLSLKSPNKHTKSFTKSPIILTRGSQKGEGVGLTFGENSQIIMRASLSHESWCTIIGSQLPHIFKISIITIKIKVMLQLNATIIIWRIPRRPCYKFTPAEISFVCSVWWMVWWLAGTLQQTWGTFDSW